MAKFFAVPVRKFDEPKWWRVIKQDGAEEQIADFSSAELAKEYCEFKNGQDSS